MSSTRSNKPTESSFPSVKKLEEALRRFEEWTVKSSPFKLIPYEKQVPKPPKDKKDALPESD